MALFGHRLVRFDVPVILQQVVAPLNQRQRRGFAQGFQNPCACPVKPAFYRSYGAAAYMGRFFIAETEYPDQH
jgi:hypothetical protein